MEQTITGCNNIEWHSMSIQEVIDILAYEADEFRGLARDYTGDSRLLYDRKYRAHILATDVLRRILQPNNAPEAAYAEIARLTAERDAAIVDCSRFPCYSCAEWPRLTEKCHGCTDNPKTTKRKKNHVWRGLCAENAPEVSI